MDYSFCLWGSCC